jgi:hypothetical protein
VAVGHPAGRAGPQRPAGLVVGRPLAAFGVVYVAVREGIENWQAETVDDCC